MWVYTRRNVARSRAHRGVRVRPTTSDGCFCSGGGGDDERNDRREKIVTGAAATAARARPCEKPSDKLLRPPSDLHINKFFRRRYSDNYSSADETGQSDVFGIPSECKTKNKIKTKRPAAAGYADAIIDAFVSFLLFDRRVVGHPTQWPSSSRVCRPPHIRNNARDRSRTLLGSIPNTAFFQSLKWKKFMKKRNI